MTEQLYILPPVTAEQLREIKVGLSLCQSPVCRMLLDHIESETIQAERAGRDMFKEVIASAEGDPFIPFSFGGFRAIFFTRHGREPGPRDAFAAGMRAAVELAREEQE